MARKDEFDFDIPSKKEKKEKAQREEKERKPLFDEGSFLGGLFKKSSSFDDSSIEDESFFDEEKKNNRKSFKHLKWWHILLMVLGATLIVVGIIAGILIGKARDMASDIGGEGNGEELPETEGEVSSVGRFLPNDTQEYILCEYTEYFSGKTMIALQKPNDVLYDYQSYWVVLDNGKPLDYLSNTFNPENSTPEEFEQEINSIVLPQFGYSEEQIELCELHIYNPVSFSRVTISEVTLTETEVTVKYSAGAVDGEMSEEYTLTGTYTKEGNDYTFTYTNFPEDEHLLRVAENLLGSARYESYAQYGAWVNELTFGDNYKLTLISSTEEE